MKSLLFWVNVLFFAFLMFSCGYVDESEMEMLENELLGISEGTWYKLTAIHSKMVIDVAGYSKNNGGSIHQYDYRGTANQQWRFNKKGSGYYEIISRNSGKCLEVYGWSGDDGAKLVQWDCHGGANQLWKLEDKGGSYNLVNKNSGKCADVRDISKDKGAKLQQWTCWRGDNQKFRIQSVGGSSSGNNNSDNNSNNESSTLKWKKANLTWYESYPEPGSEECLENNGCYWAGYFAALDDKQSESWVKNHNIVSVHSRDFSKYRMKTLRIRKGSKQIDAVVYDKCADSDCKGCCTENAKETGFLLDLEKYTKQRFGSGSGVVEWSCIDC